MAGQPTVMCWCCGNVYNRKIIRLVRNPLAGNRVYNSVCSTCQLNIAHAKTAEEENKR